MFGTATGAMRAKNVCRALDSDATAKDNEVLRTKLKSLVTRGVLTETEPGLFTLASPPTPA